jgi:LmbE family N-acetylglucosaminyl deacetylase
MPGTLDNNHPGALAAAPVEEVAGKITRYIRELKPQVVLTFDPIGGYRHPDHIAIHKATLEAFNQAGDPDHDNGVPPHQPQKLYYHTISRGFLKLAVWLLRLTGKDPRRWGQNDDIDLVSILDEDFPVHARIDYRNVEHRKNAAAVCHASQGGGGLASGPIRWVFRLIQGASKDGFMRAFPPAEPGKYEEDLFEGVV